jgi:predicted amidohydrolase YtcJ
MKQLFINAVFHLMTGPDELAEAVLTEDGKIIEVFPKQPQKFPDCELIDLQGRHVYPGFIDTHTHSFEGGLYAQSLDLSTAKTLKQVLEMVDVYYIQGKAAKTEQLDAFRFDENNTDMKRFPTMQELDKVCPDIPLILRRVDGHSSIVNTLAWNTFCNANRKYFNQSGFPSIPSEGESRSEGFVLRGSLNDSVVHWFHGICSEETILKSYKLASDIALSHGITTVHTMVGDAKDSIMHYNFLQDNLSHFDAEFILYPQSFNISAALDAGAKRIGGCILADGSLGSYTAALQLPYIDKPDKFGSLYHDDTFWSKFIYEAAGHNLQVAVHCIGDKAIRQINNVYLDLARKGKSDLRLQLIHCELTPYDLVEEIIQSGAIPVMQPAFDKYWGGESGYYQQVLGNSRMKTMNRFKTFFKRGVRITGGSDWYVTELDALAGIHAAMNHHTPEERLTPYEAITMYTTNAAFLSQDETRLGMIKEAYDADFVCIDREISDIMALSNLNIDSTFKKGKKVFSK